MVSGQEEKEFAKSMLTGYSDLLLGDRADHYI